MSQPAAKAQEAVARNPTWYHTIDLPGGVATPGHVDWRRHAPGLLPADLRGARALDIGTFDGFWAFELEKRGADVVAVDLDEVSDADWPPVHRDRLRADVAARGTELGLGFRLAHEQLGSSVRRVPCNVLDLTPETVAGPVDFAFLGALLIHLRDPVRALENIRNSLKPGGTLLMVEGISLRQTLLHPRTPLAHFDTVRNPFNWWLPNLRTLHHYLWVAGFERSRRLKLVRPPAKPEMRCWYCAIEARAPDG
jgi:SAM-dependent methyltransferase